jgi:hypothetical protein
MVSGEQLAVTVHLPVAVVFDEEGGDGSVLVLARGGPRTTRLGSSNSLSFSFVCAKVSDAPRPKPCLNFTRSPCNWAISPS